MDHQNHSRAPPAKTTRTAKASLSSLSASVPALPSAMPSVLSVSAKAPLPSAETALSPDRDLHGVPAGRRGNAEKN